MLTQRLRRKELSILQINHQSCDNSSLKTSLLFSLEVSSSRCPGGAGILICGFKHSDSAITQISGSVMDSDTAIFTLDLFVNEKHQSEFQRCLMIYNCVIVSHFRMFLENLCLSLTLLQIRILSNYTELRQGNLESRNCH